MNLYNFELSGTSTVFLDLKVSQTLAVLGEFDCVACWLLSFIGCYTSKVTSLQHSSKTALRFLCSGDEI